MPVLISICQYCTVLSVLPERNAGSNACCCFNACCCNNAASRGLTVPLTVLLCYNTVTNSLSHLLRTTAPGRGSTVLHQLHSAWRPRQRGQHLLHEPVPRRPRDRPAAHVRLNLEDALPANYGHASCLKGTWHTKSAAPQAASCGMSSLAAMVCFQSR